MPYSTFALQSVQQEFGLTLHKTVHFLLALEPVLSERPEQKPCRWRSLKAMKRREVTGLSIQF